MWKCKHYTNICEQRFIVRHGFFSQFGQTPGQFIESTQVTLTFCSNKWGFLLISWQPKWRSPLPQTKTVLLNSASVCAITTITVYQLIFATNECLVKIEVNISETSVTLILLWLVDQFNWGKLVCVRMGAIIADITFFLKSIIECYFVDSLAISFRVLFVQIFSFQCQRVFFCSCFAETEVWNWSILKLVINKVQIQTQRIA